MGAGCVQGGARTSGAGPLNWDAMGSSGVTSREWLAVLRASLVMVGRHVVTRTATAVRIRCVPCSAASRRIRHAPGTTLRRAVHRIRPCAALAGPLFARQGGGQLPVDGGKPVLSEALGGRSQPEGEGLRQHETPGLRAPRSRALICIGFNDRLRPTLRPFHDKLPERGPRLFGAAHTAPSSTSLTAQSSPSPASRS